ncbi:MAG: cation:proton antiporter [Chloroflexi bacterium]|nr:cation:proton antiporter [Chloroflexota bacterium]
MESDITEVLTRLIFQLAIILLAAKIGGEVCQRFLKVPPVLGELAAGIIIGPFALGGLSMGDLGPLFEGGGAGHGDPVSAIPREIYILGQIAAVVLLFQAGLETDLKQFLRSLGPASAVAAGGVILPFLLGAGATVAFGYADSLGDSHALFMGAVLTATSIGITVRVFSELGRLATREGVTVVGAAVVDDVLGILVLTVVVGITESGGISIGRIGLVSGKAIGFWVALTGAGILGARWISKALEGFQVDGARVALALALAFFAAALAEAAGLAMIIGAYSIGLALSGTSLAHRVAQPLKGLHDSTVPIFFVVMGMLVDLSAVQHAILFGVVVSALAIVGKLLGSGLPALMTGFGMGGALRVGLGMIPRGEVALIIAGIGLARGVIDDRLFGVSILMTVITTLLGPIALALVLRREAAGTRGSQPTPAE